VGVGVGVPLRVSVAANDADQAANDADQAVYEL
jgi:hypothetical protein